jgi:nucleotide-binding universal stress UspA family protein
MYAAFNSILVAVDGHQGGLDAAALARVLAGPEVDVAIAHVVPGDASPGAGEPVWHDDEAVEQARAILERESAPVVVTRGQSIASGLHELADAREAELLVVGAHHHRHLDLRWRDHTRAALRELPCAVAVATWGYAARPPEPVRSVGVGFVDDASGRLVLDTARGVAWQLGAEVHATMVVGPSNWKAADSGTGWRAAAAAQRMAEIPGIHGVAVEGHPHRALALLSAKVDLLVIGSAHHHALRRLLLGDVAEILSHSSRCPLLVVPHPPRHT